MARNKNRRIATEKANARERLCIGIDRYGAALLNLEVQKHEDT